MNHMKRRLFVLLLTIIVVFGGLELTKIFDMQNGLACENNISNSPPEFWRAPLQEEINDKTNWTYAQFIEQYENLRNKNPEYITKNIIINDTSGAYPIYEYVFTPKSYDQTIFLTAGMHGDEFYGYWGLYRLLNTMCEQNSGNSQFNKLRNNVRIVVIPVVNPWGMENFTRRNSRDVNCNRNFDIYWDQLKIDKGGSKEPFSENEAKAIKMICDKYSGSLDLYLDLHSTRDRDVYDPAYFYSDGSSISAALDRTRNYFWEKWAEEYNKKFTVYVDPEIVPCSTTWTNLVCKIPSATVEFSDWTLTKHSGSPEESTASLEYYTNCIFQCIYDNYQLSKTRN